MDILRKAKANKGKDDRARIHDPIKSLQSNGCLLEALVDRLETQEPDQRAADRRVMEAKILEMRRELRTTIELLELNHMLQSWNSGSQKD